MCGNCLTHIRKSWRSWRSWQTRNPFRHLSNKRRSITLFQKHTVLRSRVVTSRNTDLWNHVPANFWNFRLWHNTVLWKKEQRGEQMYSHLKNLAEIGVFRGQIASRTLEKRKKWIGTQGILMQKRCENYTKILFCCLPWTELKVLKSSRKGMSSIKHLFFVKYLCKGTQE